MALRLYMDAYKRMDGQAVSYLGKEDYCYFGTEDYCFAGFCVGICSGFVDLAGLGLRALGLRALGCEP